MSYVIRLGQLLSLKKKEVEPQRYRFPPEDEFLEKRGQYHVLLVQTRLWKSWFSDWFVSFMMKFKNDDSFRPIVADGIGGEWLYPMDLETGHVFVISSSSRLPYYVTSFAATVTKVVGKYAPNGYYPQYLTALDRQHPERENTVCSDAEYLERIGQVVPAATNIRKTPKCLKQQNAKNQEWPDTICPDGLRVTYVPWRGKR